MGDLLSYILLTVIQAYQDDVRVITKDIVQWNLVYGWKYFPHKRDSNLGPLDQ